MRVIPVIDLMAGQVVRAVRGERAGYRPIRSKLCTGSAPLDVACALLDYCGADTLYIADLDALGGGTAQIPLLAALIQALPHTAIWLDGGFRDAAAFSALTQPLGQQLGSAAAQLTPVFASESLATTHAARACLADPQRAILSLDRRGDLALDPASCWSNETLWPARIIVMTLERVGTDSGPDLQTLAEVRRRAPGARLIGAGGIRGAADLQAAAEAGAEAWLVASALHEGRLPRYAGSR
ncbi:MAG: HisA/HisF-related TIM barrel protein [Azoarcus sp.]|nr:HisA/HisF-related TIM barrel protein [Azoarcus sp.]